MAEKQTVSREEFMWTHKRALMAGTIKALGLAKRVPDLMRKRGWPVQSLDLVSILMGAVVAMKWGAGRELFRRPHEADRLGGLWPKQVTHATAKEICDTLELDDLLIPA